MAKIKKTPVSTINEETLEFQKKILDFHEKYLKKFEKFAAILNERLEEHENVLREILRTNQCIDETQCNVLLAIRQNEYLQAYYPTHVKEIRRA